MISQETIDRIIRFDSGGLPVVSLYVGFEPDPLANRAMFTQVASLLDRIRPMTTNETLGRDARLSLRKDIARIEDAARQERWKPGTHAVFSCGGRDFFEEVALPRRIRERIMVDDAPWVRPMLAVLDEHHRTCAAMIDRGRAQIWELYLDEMREVEKLRDPTLRKLNFAHGRVETHVRNKSDEMTKKHYRKVAGMLDELLRASSFDLLAIGGQPSEVPPFTDYLSRDLRKRLVGTFQADPGTVTSADIRRTVESIVDGYEQEEDRRAVADVLELAATGRPAAVGLADTLWAASAAAVQHLVVDDGAIAPGVVCDESGWLATEGAICPMCGGPTRPTADVIDELVETVIDDGGSIEHIEAETDLRKHQVAAALRFPLPPRPEG